MAASERRQCAWVWGAGPKSRVALQELERIGRLPPGTVRDFQGRMRLTDPDFMSVPDLAPGAVTRFRHRHASLPTADEVLRFGAPNLATMAGGLAVRARERNIRFHEVAFEDHGIGPGDAELPNATDTLLFFGADAVTLRTLPAYRATFEIVREALAPDARVVLMHCWAFSDGGRLALQLSAILRCPVIGMTGLQTVGDQQIQGQVFRAHEGRVDRAPGVSPWVTHFD